MKNMKSRIIVCPNAAALRISGINVIRGNCYLRQVVKEVVEQYLRGQHWQEREEQRSHCHAEHVAEVGTCSHQQVLHHVAKGSAPFDDSIVEHAQTAFQQDNIGGVLATSTAVDTEMPTSAACSEGASLMPSPM